MSIANKPFAAGRCIIQQVKVPLSKLFSAFIYIGLVAFGGGGNAQLYQAIVLRRGWMEEREFLETTALCRILPGPVFANTAAHIEMRLGGVVGGVLAMLGVLTPGAILMLLLSFAYFRFGAVPGSLAESALGGVAAAAIGLILATIPHCAGLPQGGGSGPAGICDLWPAALAVAAGTAADGSAGATNRSPCHTARCWGKVNKRSCICFAGIPSARPAK